VNNVEVPKGRARRLALAAGTMAVVSLVAAACGGAAAASTSSNKAAAASTAPSPVATGLQAAGSSGSSPGSGSSGGPPAAFRPAAFGMIASVSGDTLEVQNAETGQTTVDLSSKTNITATVSVSQSDVVKGGCISATGTKGSGGSVDASNVAIFSATKGECTRGFGAGGGGFPVPRGTFPTRTTGTRPATTFRRPANFATASGKVTSKSGSKINVQAVTVSFSNGKVTTKTGPKTVNVSKSTKYSKSERVAAGSLKVGECVTATGATNNIGAVSATTLIVTQATSSGCPTFAGFGGFGGGFGGRGGGSGGPGGGAA
jgi:hypothetical protein